MKSESAYGLLILAFVAGAAAAIGAFVAKRDHARNDVDGDSQSLDEQDLYQDDSPARTSPANAIDKDTVLKLCVGDFWSPEDLKHPDANGTRR